MVRLRLRRIGAKAQPSYRVIAAEKEAPRDGRFIEILGNYNPRTEPATIQLDEARIYDWLSKGAQPSESVAQLFKTTGLAERYERLKKGEALETLLEEAKAADTVRNINPRTEHTSAAKR